jgi:hypothetical protein
MTDTTNSGAEPQGVVGGVRLLLRLEGLALFFGALTGFVISGQPWWLFAALILVPDLSMLGYLAGHRAGAVAYNTVHVTIAPIVLTVAGLALVNLQVFAVAMIWLAHIGIDRALGYGLKYGAGFGFTHLGRIGRAAPREPAGARPGR